ncbi:Multidrug resistance protein MdtG [Apilactobacillus kunkeei]|nr:Multidrug resistance protein MdtG [Apilactobacillus kunkeei]CAI2648566.1 Multidrug resistance protein MdtG [Apilactobacillus kunkeei]CAI2803180.1 Multidrug resistance protein MdtG [Apilactobacillus kunkeei]
MNDKYWIKNLLILLFGTFLTGIAFSEVIPFQPLYISELGSFSKSELSLWSGIVYASSFVVVIFTSAMWGTVFTETFISNYELYRLRNHLNLKELFKNLKGCCISSVVMFVVVYTLSTSFKFNFLILMLSIITGVFVYVISLAITDLKRFKLEYKRIKSYFCKKEG